MSQENPESATFEKLELRVDWSVADAMPATYANQVLTQVTADEAILIFGQITPPTIVGGPEAIRAHFAQQNSIAVHPVAKVVLTPAKLFELIEVLGDTAEKYERAKALREADEVVEADEDQP